ncbi:hypothetical protein CTI12_AA157800 [Artemisia annua]|uniref:Uncharacterized protein n=1 Tax=Artemisia annua TaxID=35608 RepID=A0A2U1PFV7_ARTAN|nr:hypothetical protein CTI12_AA157800 [Artemisia annua]
MLQGRIIERLSIEYEDRDEMTVAHMVDGVDAFINVPQGWLIANSTLKLLSLKGSSQSSKEVTLSFICKVEIGSKSGEVFITINCDKWCNNHHQSLVKAAKLSKSRLSIEYEDRDEMIAAHMVDGVDAFIKFSYLKESTFDLRFL